MFPPGCSCTIIVLVAKETIVNNREINKNEKKKKIVGAVPVQKLYKYKFPKNMHFSL